MYVSEEQRRVGVENFQAAFGLARRDLLRSAVAGGLSLAGGLGPLAFGYGGPGDMSQPVRVGVIGAGDQGGILIGALQPEYVQVTALCDIRPSAIHRAWHGDWSSTAAARLRPGLLSKYGWASEDVAQRQVKVFTDFRDLLKSDDVEAVVIALPLHLHHPVALAALAAGKDLFVESLFAQTVRQCKEIARQARQLQRVCAVGHQRHYSLLYQSAGELLRRNLLGQVCAIHAQWHRANAPGADSWQPPLPGGELAADGRHHDMIGERLRGLETQLVRLRRDAVPDHHRIAQVERQLAQWAAWDQDRNVDAKEHAYQDAWIGGRLRTALEELCRWRLSDRTCGGLMNGLGYHQIDAALLLLTAMEGAEPRPLSVFATGDRSLFPDTREADDHATCVIEFAGPAYEAVADPRSTFGFFDRIAGYPASGIPGFDQDPHKKITLVVSLTNGNGFASHGERVLGTKGTLQLHREQEALLFNRFGGNPVTVEEARGRLELKDARPGQRPPEAGLAQAVAAEHPSRGYREAMEHWAWCIRHPDRENQPRCGPQQALRTAAVTLACTRAIELGKQGTSRAYPFHPQWLNIDSDRTPEADMTRE